MLRLNQYERTDMIPLAKSLTIIACFSFIVSCDPRSEDPEITTEEACEGAFAFPLIPVDPTTISEFENFIGDLDMSQSPDDEECGDYMKNIADEMVRDAILGSGLPYEELTEFRYTSEWFTGSATQEPYCELISVLVTRKVCDTLTRVPYMKIVWKANGELEKIVSDYSGSDYPGFVDYQNPIKDCDSDLWTLETCGGIYANSNNAYEYENLYAYEYQWKDGEKQLVKGMAAYCDLLLGYLWVPVCDDYLPNGSDTVCGTNFCSDQ